jgi:hypothetical protein
VGYPNQSPSSTGAVAAPNQDVFPDRSLQLGREWDRADQSQFSVRVDEVISERRRSLPVSAD